MEMCSTHIGETMKLKYFLDQGFEKVTTERRGEIIPCLQNPYLDLSDHEFFEKVALVGSFILSVDSPAFHLYYLMESRTAGSRELIVVGDLDA